MRAGVAERLASSADNWAGAGHDRVHVLCLLLGPGAMSTRTEAAREAARKRSRCVWWLCGQCHGGSACRCVPVPQPRQPATDTATQERQR